MCILPSSGVDVAPHHKHFQHFQQAYFKLLNSLAGMLPKPVADDLRQGRTAEAQSFSNATVYFRCVLCKAGLLQSNL